MNYDITFWAAIIGVIWLINGLVGLKRGKIWAGSLGFKPFRPTRQERPILFWLCTLFFIVFGGGMLIFAALGYLGVINPKAIF